MNILFALTQVALWYSIQAVSQNATLKFGRTELVGLAIEPNHQEFYGGIPYAEPPTGKLRLQPPVLKNTLNTSKFDAQSYGTRCVQAPSNATANATFSEDCLTINVIRPAGLDRNASIPVMVWIYGGGFYEGDASFYNGSEIVAHSVSRGTPLIYVNFNYRVGPLGFPQGTEANKRGILNLGLKDQLTALKWVQKNIHYFGGAKDKVTVFGESAGSISIAILMLTPDMSKLVRGAILESGSASTTPVYNATGKTRESDWQAFVRAVPDCASVAEGQNTVPCLQKASANAISTAFINATNNSDFSWTPSIDGPDGLLPDLPSLQWQRGRFARVPFIQGTNLDEGTGFFNASGNYSTEVIRDFLITDFPPTNQSTQEFDQVIDGLLKLYPEDPSVGCPFGTGNDTFGYDPGYKRVAALGTDLLFTGPRRGRIQLASNASIDAWGYLFTDPQNVTSIGTTHTTEIDYVYGVLNSSYSTHQSLVSPLNMTSAVQLSGIMTDYWISFATSLNPNDGKGNARPEWTKYTPSSQNILQLDGRNITMIPDTYRKEQIDYINSNAVAFHH